MFLSEHYYDCINNIKHFLRSKTVDLCVCKKIGIMSLGCCQFVEKNIQRLFFAVCFHYCSNVGKKALLTATK